MRRIITQKRLRLYSRLHPGSAASLLHWEKTVLAATWVTPADARQTFNDVDAVQVNSGNTVYVFNIQGNAHRLIAAIHYKSQMVYVLGIMTHSEYDLDHWKADL